MNINPNTKQAYQLFHDGILALHRAEQAGIRVDLEYIERKKKHINRKILVLEERFKDTRFFRHWQHVSKGKVNIHSNFQLAHVLYDVKKIVPEKTTVTEKGSTDEEALSALDIPEMDDLLEIRKLMKIRDTYLDAFLREQVDGYIHPFFNLNLVRTFRSSSDSPNLQNIPKHDEESMQICRKALYPRPGHQLLELDFKSMEVKISACYNKDPNLMKYVSDPSTDMHGDMAKQIFILNKLDKTIAGHDTLRQAAKNSFVFPEFYGSYWANCTKGLARDWGELPKGKWKPGQGILLPDGHLSDHLISKGIKEYGEIKKDRFGHTSVTGFLGHVKKVESDFWEVRFRVYKEWKEEWYAEYLTKGYFDMFTGFRCSGVMYKNDVVNYPVQGAAFHCLLWSFIQMDQILRGRGMDSRLIGQIHDSMLLDVLPKELEMVCRIAKRIVTEKLPAVWKWIIVPMGIDAEVAPVDGSWAEKEKLTI
jgi:DNA polymerase-1